MKPVLFVTGHAPPERVGALARLHEREDIEVALFGGRSRHGPGTAGESSSDGSPGTAGGSSSDEGPGTAGRSSSDEGPDTAGRSSSDEGPDTARGSSSDGSPGGPTASRPELPFPHRYVRQHETGGLAASGAYRAVVCSSGGRLALPATWAGARRAGAPLILWASLWAHPRSLPHLFSYLALRRLYRSADAIVTYGPHVSEYVRGGGARNVHVAPQSVENAFWGAPVTTQPSDPAWPGEARVKFVFAGRPDREKGVGTLIAAWRRSGLRAPSAALVLVGVGSDTPLRAAAGGAVDCIEPVPAERLREMYADADVLVVPSIRTRTFREPWGLVINEAMNRGLATIASDAVGAVAGGLVRDGHNGLVVAAGDSDALARAMVRLAADPELRARLGAAGARDVSAYTHDAWAEGFSTALATVGLSRTHC